MNAHRPHRPRRPVRLVLLCAFACWALAGTLQAQGNTDPNWMPYSDSLGNVMKLTPEQRKAMHDLDMRYETQYDQLGNDELRKQQLLVVVYLSFANVSDTFFLAQIRHVPVNIVVQS